MVVAGCATEIEAPQETLQPQRVRVGVSAQQGSFLSFHLLATDGSAAIPCDEGSIEAAIRYRRPGADWADLPQGTVTARCTEAANGDVALVLDNSGSESGYVPSVQAGAQTMVDGVLGQGGQASLVRVSTNSEVLSPVTDDAAALTAAIDGLASTNGWTALYDGVRMGNETLGGAVQDRQVAGIWPDLDTFCSAQEPLGIVAFTDGRENNSAEQQDYDKDRYPGDGLDTRLTDLYNLRVMGVTTPIYTVGLGDEPDHAALAELASVTGGRHVRVDEPSQVEGVFADFTDYFSSTSQVCAAMPSAACGTLEVELNWTWTRGEEVVTGTELSTVTAPCPADQQQQVGRMVTFILTISKPSIGETTSQRLVTNAVDWVAPIEDPKVLVVLDDGRRFEFPTDPGFVEDTLLATGLSVDVLEEPEQGIQPADLVGYDVVWFSNPGWPVDDLASRDTLLQFQALGGGLVLQGDDITWALGQAFTMTPLTKLEHVNNGTPYCGVRINNNTGNAYEVTMGSDHPVLAGLEGTTFLYTDDIDVTTPANVGEQVLATANLPGGSECPSHPAIVVFDPAGQ